MKIRALLSAVLLGAAFAPSPTLAHSVYIFAWVDGDRVCTESYFTRKSKVRGGEVLMSDPGGEILAKGVTGDDGILCFPLPAKIQPLHFSVLAGAGHKGDFRLEEKDFAEAARIEPTTQDAPAPSETASPPAAPDQKPAVAAEMAGGAQTDGVSEQRLRAIMQEELQKQLSPMRRYLAEKLEDDTPGLREIVGGAGWLVGLGALGFWWSQRRKRR